MSAFHGSFSSIWTDDSCRKAAYESSGSARRLACPPFYAANEAAVRMENQSSTRESLRRTITRAAVLLTDGVAGKDS